MANIHIPSIHLPGIKRISELSEDQVKVIYEILIKSPSGLGVEKFSSNFSDIFRDKSMELVAKAIFSFGQLMSYPDFEAKEIAGELTESYQELAKDQLSESVRNRLEERLYNILINSGFLITSNEAYKILSDLKVIRKSIVTTDIRLLSSGDPNYTNRNALLLYKLLIRFAIDGDADSEMFYLDRDDLKDLKSQIDVILSTEENIRKSNEGILNFIELT